MFCAGISNCGSAVVHILTTCGILLKFEVFDGVAEQAWVQEPVATHECARSIDQTTTGRLWKFATLGYAPTQ